MSTYDAGILVATGFVYGMLFGRYFWGRRPASAEIARLEAVIREHAAPADPEARRCERLAYDTIYDERHPEEWAR